MRIELLDLIERQPQLGDLAERLRSLLEELPDNGSAPRRLVVKSDRGGLLILDVSEIDWIDAAGKCCRINAAGKSHTIRESIGSLEGRLDPARLFRIHRSTIVNLERIREIRPRTHGNHLVVLDDGTRLNLARGSRESLVELLLRQDRPARAGRGIPAG